MRKLCGIKWIGSAITCSSDTQQIAAWGRTEQPGSTYYLQKVSSDILGIVDHSEEKSTVYLFDERIGPKNTDHTISFFLDNATSTNKNKYLFSWAMEVVSREEVDHIHISFMIAGHTKFTPDCLFSQIGCAYKT